MRKEAERKVAERQAWIIVEKVTEMEAEKKVCDMMIESMQDEVPTESEQIGRQLIEIRTKSQTLNARIKALNQVLE